ncbi:MAG: hypothetical protein MI748_14835 [Opitutales bacterium]|nr:hypothetical protein [Opitutales bacterium]
MDAITAAVALISEQAMMERLDATMRIIKSNEQATRGLVDMITSSASSGTLYSPSGFVSQESVGQKLDTVA